MQSVHADAWVYQYLGTVDQYTHLRCPPSPKQELEALCAQY